MVSSKAVEGRVMTKPLTDEFVRPYHWLIYCERQGYRIEENREMYWTRSSVNCLIKEHPREYAVWVAKYRLNLNNKGEFDALI